MRKSFLGFLGLILMLAACEKPESKLGLELLPDAENLGFAVDSSTVILNQVYHDSLVTNRLEFALLGDFDDPIIGNTTANIYSQIRLSNPNLNFGGSATIDSLILSVAYSGNHYGDLDDFLISVQQITDTMYLDSTYYSYDELAVDGIELVDPSRNIITPAPNDDVVVGGDTLAPHMRIKLLDDWGTNSILETDVINVENNENFLEHIHGLKITATKQSGSGGIVYMNLISSLSNMIIYYHTLTQDSLSYEFVINTQSQQFVQFEHDYNSAIISSIDDGIQEMDEAIIQSTAGLGIEVMLPNIHDFAEEDIVINRAVLELPVSDFADVESFKPDSILRAVYNFEGVDVNVPDATLSGSGIDYVGGYYDEENNIYKVTVTRFVQQVLNGQIEEPIFTVYPLRSRTVANRTRIKVGNIDEDRRTKLIINYTTY